MKTSDFPVCLRLDGRPVLVVGGGEVGEARVRALLEAGARVRVIAPVASEGLRRLAKEGRLELHERAYRTGDLGGSAVVFTAIDDPGGSRAIVHEARELGIWVNAADLPELCDFTLPSVGRRGPITLAVSTSGFAPALGAALRRRLVAEIRPEQVWLARLSGWIRRTRGAGHERRELLHSLGSDVDALSHARRRETWARLRAGLRSLHGVP